MTTTLVLLALLSIATIASRRGAFEELIQSASTPLLVGVGVLVSPRVLGLLPPSTLSGLEPAMDLGAAALAFFIGARATTPTGEPTGARSNIAGAGAVLLSCAAAAVALLVAAQLIGTTTDTSETIAFALIVGACLAALPAESAHTPPRVRAWAHATELASLAAALVGLSMLASAPAEFLLVSCATAAAAAALLVLSPSADPVARTVTVLGVLALVAGLMRLVEAPTAACGFVAGIVIGRTRLAEDVAQISQRARRPVRVVLTILVGAALGLDWHSTAIGAALAVGQLGVQLGAARVMGVHRTQLGSALASSATPIAWVAAIAGAASFASVHDLLPAILVAIALSDLLAVFVSLAQRRAWNEERTDPGAAR